MRTTNDIHILFKDGSWLVEVTDQGQHGGEHKTQQEAIETGRQLAVQECKELVIHGENGAISHRESFEHKLDRSA